MMMLRGLPFEPGLTSLHREMSRWLDGRADLPNGNGDGRRTWMPPVDYVESAEALHVKVELPGVDPEKIDIQVRDDRLEIRAERDEERPAEKPNWARYERVTGRFERVIELPMPVEADRIEAESRHGVLTVTLPKKAEILPRKIPVKTA